jgi:hypothetical protein
VSRIGKSLTLVAATLMSYSSALLAQGEISDAADLTAVIALNGKPCGKVVNAAKRGEDDYVATCEDGNRYRVFIRDGRVIVEKTN